MKHGTLNYIGIGLLFYALSLLRTGFYVLQDNHSIQLPLVYWLQNASLYPGDAFVATLSGYVSLFWPFVAFISRGGDPQFTLLILFLIERALMILASAVLAATIIPSSRLAVYGAMALVSFTISPLVGDGTLVRAFCEQTSVAVVFTLFTISALYKGKKYLAAILLAIVFNLNIMYGLFALSYLLAVYYALNSRLSIRRSWIGPILLFVAACIPVAIMTIVAHGNKEADTKEWIEQLRFFYPYHFFPESWQPRSVVTYAVLVLFSFLVFRRTRLRESKFWSWNIAFLMTNLAWVFVAYAAAYWVKSPTLLVLHPARATDIWYVFGGISLVSILGSYVERQTHEGIRSFWFALFFASIAIWNESFAPHPLVILGAAAIVCSPLQLLTRRPVLCLVIWACVSIVGSFSLRALEANSIQKALIIRPDPQIEVIAKWAKIQSLPSDQFLVDPTWDQFRALSHRGVFLVWYDGSAIMWDRSFSSEYAKRMALCGYSAGRPKSAIHSELNRDVMSAIYKGMNDKFVAKLSAEYPKVKYWVTTLKTHSNYREVYRSTEYKILQISSLTTREGD